MKEVTSRGSSEEHWYSVKHALHTEGHLEEMISQAASRGDYKELSHLAKVLDDTRNQRQRLVQEAFLFEAGGRMTPGFLNQLNTYWCSIKHIILLEGHLEEMIANAARQKNNQAIQKIGSELHHTMNRRKQMIAQLVKAPGKLAQGDGPGCIRCAADLMAPKKPSLPAPRNLFKSKNGTGFG